jgi:hypothetical protein
MLCPDCDSYPKLYRSVARSRGWTEISIRLLLDDARVRKPREELVEKLEMAFATYFLEIFMIEDVVGVAYTALLNCIRVVTKHSTEKIKQILSTLSQREVSKRIYKPPLPETARREGAFIKLGFLTLYAPKEDVSLETLLRYELIRRAWKLDWSLCFGQIVAGIPTTLGKGNYYSLYKDPETQGIFSGSSRQTISTILSGSKTWNTRLVAELKEGKRSLRLLTQDPEQAELFGKDGFIVFPVANPTLYIIGNIDFDTIKTELISRFRPLPKVPIEFDNMFENLAKLADNLPVHWARFLKPQNKGDITTPDLTLGLVSRSYPEDYYSGDSISDVFSYMQRLSCSTTNRRTGKTKESQVELWRKVRAFYHFFMEQKHLSSEAELLDYFYANAGACGIFNAGLATYVYGRFGGVGSRILDGFAGWTDRVIAAAASFCDEYRGFDTNPAIPYEKALDALRKKRGNLIDSYSIEIKPFEEAELKDDYFDVALLSPPFYRYEIYAGETTSTKKYNSLDAWIEQFWKPCLMKTLRAMRLGGWILLYLPAGKDETAEAMHKAVKDVYEGGVFTQGTLGFVQTSASGPMKIRHLFVYRKI